jgi:hypothetical protein
VFCGLLAGCECDAQPPRGDGGSLFDATTSADTSMDVALVPDMSIDLALAVDTESSDARMDAAGATMDAGDAEPRRDAPPATGCVWMAPPPAFGRCDGMQVAACDQWAIVSTLDSTLQAFAMCDPSNGRCVSADRSTGGVLDCGTGPACADGAACGQRPGEAQPTCVTCPAGDF